MENSQSPHQPEIDDETTKEIKRHKSAHIPAGSEALNKMFNKDNSIDSNSFNLNQNTNPGLFKIKSTSIFAYQEFDRFSSFCDNEEKNKRSEENNIKDEFNNISTSFSMESQNSNNIMNRRSMPTHLPQYLNTKNQRLGSISNIGISYPFEEISNNNINNDIRRRNTQKLNRNYINTFFKSNNNSNINNNIINNNNNSNNNIINTSSSNININNIDSLNANENRKKSRSLYFKESSYNDNQNGMNLFPNNFFINNNNMQFNEKKIDDESNLENNNYEDNEFLIEYGGIMRRKSNSLAVRTNNIMGQMNQINFPFQPNNNFFNSTSKNSNMSNFLGNKDLYLKKKSNLFIICQDQSSCRNLQDQLELHKNDINYLQNFVEQIKPYLINIMTHQFGNYVIQKLLEILIYQKNKALINEVISIIDQNDNLYKVTINNYGTRVVQKTLEKLLEGGYTQIKTAELNNSIINLISKHLYDLCKDKNGNHVYQKLLKVFSYETEENNNFLYEYLADISIEVSLLQQGATIFSAALNLATYKQKEIISKKIIENLDNLINNKYGNYTVQALINNFKDETKLIEPIYSYISNNIVELSRQKYSSNVIDTFIMKKDEYSKKLINDIINNGKVEEMIKDQFGNYVIQKAMSISDTKTLNEIIEQIKPIVPELLQSNIGKKIINRLTQHYNFEFQS